MAKSTASLYSTLKNVSGRTLTAGFLLPRGIPMAADEERTYFGDVQQAIQTGIDRGENERNIAAFEGMLHAGLLAVVHTPGVILESPSGTTKQLGLLDNGTLTAIDPSWARTGPVSDSLIY